jgi:hypothetical protein
LSLASDHVDLARKLIKIAKDHGAKDQVIIDLLNSETMNHGLEVKPRKYSIIVSRLKVDTCMDYTRPSLALAIESIRKSVLDAKGRDVKLRYITEITCENVRYCKELMNIADVRYLDGIKGNFMVSESEYLAPAVSNNSFNITSQIIYSNLHEIVEQQQYMFETLWSKATLSFRKVKTVCQKENWTT